MHIWQSLKVLKTSTFWSKLPNKTAEDRESINNLKIGLGLKILPKESKKIGGKPSNKD
jgi:hypothetical protein